MSKPHVVHYIRQPDVDIVLARIPEELRIRVRDIFFTSDSRGVRTLGWVMTRGRRDITLCSGLPPRVSLRSSRWIAADFGAPERGQWPPWSVRRKLLYDTLLHELGHLQIVDPEARRPKRKFAHETLAQAFAEEWRGRLYSEPFDHPDPVHNAPTDDERETLPYWESLDKAQTMLLTRIVVGDSSLDLSAMGYLPAQAGRFLRRLVRR